MYFFYMLVFNPPKEEKQADQKNNSIPETFSRLELPKI